jgi:hypothetical protein
MRLPRIACFIFVLTLLVPSPGNSVFGSGNSVQTEQGSQGKAAASTLTLPASSAFAPTITAEGRTQPGGVLRLQASSAEGMVSLSAILWDEHGKVISRAATFRLGSSPQSDWAGLLGVPTTVPSGEYRLVVSAVKYSENYVQTFPISVAPRVFAFEEIPLDDALTLLRTAPDPDKTAEAQELAHLLSSVHQGNVFETGIFLRPVTPIRTSSGFGDRREYRYANSRQEFSVHNGVDYALAEGSPVAACGNGRVMLAGERIMTGNTVVLEHLPGCYSLYFHMSEIAVKQGDVVQNGQLLGRVGHTGLATGPHLHWEVDILGVAVDPERFLETPILDKTMDIGSIDS